MTFILYISEKLGFPHNHFQIRCYRRVQVMLCLHVCSARLTGKVFQLLHFHNNSGDDVYNKLKCVCKIYLHLNTYKYTYVVSDICQ